MHAVPLEAGQRRYAMIAEHPVKVRLLRPAPPSSWLCRAELNGSLFVVGEADIGELAPDASESGG
ncbi:MAG TPA: hypothetical protein VGX76_15350 [Pirellulales bacterium]|jgi:hypothetical protein|nr:hypothetical protein [Pirellulales bacterium]